MQKNINLVEGRDGVFEGVLLNVRRKVISWYGMLKMQTSQNDTQPINITSFSTFDSTSKIVPLHSSKHISKN
jgi:hypothetical protein